MNAFPAALLEPLLSLDLSPLSSLFRDLRHEQDRLTPPRLIAPSLKSTPLHSLPPFSQVAASAVLTKLSDIEAISSDVTHIRRTLDAGLPMHRPTPTPPAAFRPSSASKPPHDRTAPSHLPSTRGAPASEPAPPTRPAVGHGPYPPPNRTQPPTAAARDGRSNVHRGPSIDGDAALPMRFSGASLAVAAPPVPAAAAAPSPSQARPPAPPGPGSPVRDLLEDAAELRAELEALLSQSRAVLLGRGAPVGPLRDVEAMAGGGGGGAEGEDRGGVVGAGETRVSGGKTGDGVAMSAEAVARGASGSAEPSVGPELLSCDSLSPVGGAEASGGADGEGGMRTAEGWGGTTGAAPRPTGPAPTSTPSPRRVRFQAAEGAGEKGGRGEVQETATAGGRRGGKAPGWLPETVGSVEEVEGLLAFVESALEAAGSDDGGPGSNPSAGTSATRFGRPHPQDSYPAAVSPSGGNFGVSLPSRSVGIHSAMRQARSSRGSMDQLAATLSGLNLTASQSLLRHSRSLARPSQSLHRQGTGGTARGTETGGGSKEKAFDRMPAWASLMGKSRDRG